jgi:hypothetical protein
MERDLNLQEMFEPSSISKKSTKQKKGCDILCLSIGWSKSKKEEKKFKIKLYIGK